MAVFFNNILIVIYCHSLLTIYVVSPHANGFWLGDVADF